MNDLRREIVDAFQRRVDAAPMPSDMRVRIEERATRERRPFGMVLAAAIALVIALFAGGTLVYVANHARPEPKPLTTPSPVMTPTAVPSPTSQPSPTPSATPAAVTPRFAQFPVSAAEAGTTGAVAGPDGALWYTAANRVVRMDGAGGTSSYPVASSADAELGRIAVGPDQALWFTIAARDLNKIGRLTTTGKLDEFAIPTPFSQPAGITTGPDGALWFTEFLGNKIGRITTDGHITEFPLPKRVDVQCGNLCPLGITAGSDGALWFTESQLSVGGGNRIGRMTVDGTLTEYLIPTPNARPGDIAAGPDGTLWFTEQYGIGRITTSGQIHEYAMPDHGYPISVERLAVSADGTIWFTANGHEDHTLVSTRSWLGRIDTKGAVTLLDVPRAVTGVSLLAPAGDGMVWFWTKGMGATADLWRMTL